MAEASPQLEHARDLYRRGDYNAALIACVELIQTSPNTPGLVELRNRIIQASLDERVLQARDREEESKNIMSIEPVEKTGIPESYSIRRRVEDTSDPLVPPPGRMQQVLDRPVTMHLEGANLSDLIDYLSMDTNINIIADQNLGGNKTLNIHVDNTPLRELLDYISRNLGVEFYAGDHVLWAAPAGSKQGAPLKTRIYRFRRGFQFHGGDWGENSSGKTDESMIETLSRKATVLSTEKSHIERLIEQFVPPSEGSQFYLDRSSHTLFVRNTPDNLALIETIINSLDVNPPQVFIEARFVETTLSDLRELGIEWVLNSPLVTSRTTALRDGMPTRVTQTQIDEGASISFDPFSSDDSGTFPLGPQGSFGLVRPGNPQTASQGLNLTYNGILTEPMFNAVLHALDISGDGRTLSVPRVTTVNNNPAKLRNGQDLRYFEEFKAQAFNLVDEDNKRFTVTVLIPAGKPVLEELGITLVAVPSVGADRQTISLLLTPTISRLDGFLSYQDDSLGATNVANQIRQVVVKLPIISRREVQTKVVVGSGETVVMGGLIDSVQQETEHSIPFLGSIPILGNFFKRTDTTTEQKNLLIFVTATVLSERGESLLAAGRREEEGSEPVDEPRLRP